MSARLEVADIFRRHGDAYRRAHDGHLGRVERRTMSAIELCRTAGLGGHVEGCSSCGAIRVTYNSCRNRHCPRCQGQACRDWLAAREAGDLAHLAKRNALTRMLSEACSREWVVYAKPPFGGPSQVLAYLGHYIHRVAIANSPAGQHGRRSRRVPLEGLP
jgi:hypothetical protein